jgi:hypothetical protein
MNGRERAGQSTLTSTRLGSPKAGGVGHTPTRDDEPAYARLETRLGAGSGQQIHGQRRYSGSHEVARPPEVACPLDYRRSSLAPQGEQRASRATEAFTVAILRRL